MLILYNFVAVIVSLIMARPFYIDLQKSVQSSAWKCLCRACRCLLCRPSRKSPPPAVLGFLLITMAAPLLSSLSVYLGHRDSVTFANVLAE
jgi:hypothetical protein